MNKRYGCDRQMPFGLEIYNGIYIYIHMYTVINVGPHCVKLNSRIDDRSHSNTTVESYMQKPKALRALGLTK